MYIKKKAKQNKEQLVKKFNAHADEVQNFFDSYKKRQSDILNDAIVF